MKEYMFRILNDAEHDLNWPAGKRSQFLKAIEDYIGRLKQSGNLIASQPMAREGIMLSGRQGSWTTEPLASTGNVQVGYYHVKANNLDEAVELAKQNPEFSFFGSASIEIREIRTEEEDSGFMYPHQ